MTRRPWVAGFSHNPVLSPHTPLGSRSHTLSDLPAPGFFVRSAGFRPSQQLQSLEAQQLLSHSARPSSTKVSPSISRPPDRFSQAIDSYVEVMRLEGQKALSVAKDEIAASLKQKHEQDIARLRQEVSERDHRLNAALLESESRKERCLRLTAQLRNLADLLSKRSNNPVVSLVRGSANGELSLGQVLEIWHRNACVLWEERKKERMGATLYKTKLLMRIHAAWRLEAVVQNTVREQEQRVIVLDSSKDEMVKKANSERDEAREEVRQLLVELDTERSRRSAFSKTVRSKFEEFSNELTKFGSSNPGSGLF